MRIVLFFGKKPEAAYLALPLWLVLLLWGALTAPMLLAAAHWAPPLATEAEAEIAAKARQQGAAQAEKSAAEALSKLLPQLADLHFQVLQLDLQNGRLATLVGMPHEGGEPQLPERSGMLALRENNVDALRREVDFITRQLELKTDAMSMVELYLIDQHLRLRAQTEYVLPVPPGSRISSGFGLRPDPFTGERRMHQGIDFEAQEGTPVLSVADGLVTRVAALSDYGNLIEISHRNGRTSRYAHLKMALVRSGQVVRRGEAIGQVGNSGRSTGPHLHFESLELGIQHNPLSFFVRPTAATTPRRLPWVVGNELSASDGSGGRRR